jgi:hypothetical protein
VDLDKGEGVDTDESGMVYPDDMDEIGWPQDLDSDARFLHCDQHIKEQALEVLWEPFGQKHDLDFELMDIEDVSVDQLPLLSHAIGILLEEGVETDLGEYLARLQVFVSDLMRQGKGMTVSL